MAEEGLGQQVEPAGAGASAGSGGGARGRIGSLKGQMTKGNAKSALLSAASRGDLMFAAGVVMILVVLILPLPPWLLDVLLAMSITLSVLILMTTIFIERALEFNVFPVVLLIATLFRLSLNLASTRLILANGHQGPSAAGDVIQAFGGFIMGNNFVIGVIVFVILILVNFMVITKGSTRIAEVTARFTLDAMPGKQMAIDADLSSGLIDEAQARQRRIEIQKESDFFGAMDGASKFVRGDAIAGLIITAINVIGGMIIGMVQSDLTFAQAADTYTRLTVGDGLVSQIPALIISVAAGIMVSKGGLTESTEKALVGQFTSYPKALGMSAGLAVALALLPGTPAFPFLFLAGITAGAAYYLGKKQDRAAAEKAAAKAAGADGKPRTGPDGKPLPAGDHPPPVEEEPSPKP